MAAACADILPIACVLNVVVNVGVTNLDETVDVRGVIINELIAELENIHAFTSGVRLGTRKWCHYISTRHIKVDRLIPMSTPRQIALYRAG